MEFKDKVVLITGASKGIGKHLAEKLIDMGLDVPHSTLIAMELRRQGIELEGAVHTLDGLVAAILRAKEVG